MLALNVIGVVVLVLAGVTQLRAKVQALLDAPAMALFTLGGDALHWRKNVNKCSQIGRMLFTQVRASDEFQIGACQVAPGSLDAGAAKVGLSALLALDDLVNPSQVLVDPCVDARVVLLRALDAVGDDANEGAASVLGKGQRPAAVALH